VPFQSLDARSGIGFFRIPDLGSRIPNPYFRELDNFLGKKFYNSLKKKLAHIFFFSTSKLK
jgi:Na+-transporting NADH:ubiquinone oxidoreductase subunit NqrC